MDTWDVSVEEDGSRRNVFLERLRELGAVSVPTPTVNKELKVEIRRVSALLYSAIGYYRYGSIVYLVGFQLYSLAQLGTVDMVQ